MSCRRQGVRRQSKKSINSQPRMPTEHQEVRRISVRVVESCIIGKYQSWFMCFPVALLVVLQCAQQLQKRLIEALALAIPHCVKKCCSQLFCAGNVTQFFSEFRHKDLTLVAVNPRWKAIMDHKLVEQHPGCGLSRLILVGMAYAYREKWCAMTKIFSKPPFDRSRER